MTRFATELERCHSLLFAEYFNTSHSASDSILPFSQEPCGHCDNCKREPADIKHADLTVEALKICDVVSHVNKMGGRVTLIQLGDLVRGIRTPMATIIRNTQAKKNSDDIECERPGYLLGPNLTKEKILLKKEVRLHCREVYVDLIENTVAGPRSTKTCSLHAKYGFDEGEGSSGIIIVRPDGYVGSVVSLCETGWKAIERYFEGFLVESGV
ncbi:hypothetical protein KEM48_009275 [Puccinia striiformis f. sp. tritici PST-130]|nr:hypothetical protein KEM48_009275 [Puccinia striiformis f. sp. tritici PST-130]